MLAVILGQADSRPAGSSTSGGPLLRRVDEGLSDRDPLVASLRIPIADLRVPSGFEGVYQAEVAGGREVFVRRSGAVWATFPRGVYSRNSKGKTLVDMPPGMSFSIGVPAALRSPEFAPDGDAGAGFDGDRARETGAASSPYPARESIPLRGAIRMDLGRELAADSPLAEQRFDDRVDHSTDGAGGEAGRPSEHTDEAAALPVSGSAAHPREATASRASPSSRFVTRAIADEPLPEVDGRMPRFSVDEPYRRARLDAMLRQRRDSARAVQ